MSKNLKLYYLTKLTLKRPQEKLYKELCLKVIDNVNLTESFQILQKGFVFIFLTSYLQFIPNS